MPRTPKGEIAIADKDGWIQLRWRHQGKRYYLSLTLRYDPINCRIAEQRATKIRLDILSGNFDPTLEKYKTDRPTQVGTYSAVKLFERFTEEKAKRIQRRSLDKYHGLLTWMREFFGDRSATEEDAEEFISWLKENLQPVTTRERLKLLDAAWRWGIDQKLVARNPWADLRVRQIPKQLPKAFTKDEVHRIIQGFQESSYYKHYSDYVRFRFSTGCRTGEVNGLRWRHFNKDCSVVWIGESHTHGEFKDTKTGKAREVKLSASTSELLRSRLSKDVDPDDLVFSSLEGQPIDEHNFSQRAWKTVLETVGVRYLRPYYTRHTFISHALEADMSPIEVAAITGHDVKTLYEKYAGLVKSHPQAPELF